MTAGCLSPWIAAAVAVVLVARVGWADALVLMVAVLVVALVYGVLRHGFVGHR